MQYFLDDFIILLTNRKNACLPGIMNSEDYSGLPVHLQRIMFGSIKTTYFEKYLITAPVFPLAKNGFAT
jgi:hypothetical protein